MGHWKCHRLQNKKCKNLIWHFDIQRCSLLLKSALLFSKEEAIAQLFWGSDSIIRIIGNKTQQRQRGREALAFISFVIDHTYDKITQEGENGIWHAFAFWAIFTVALHHSYNSKPHWSIQQNYMDVFWIQISVCCVVADAVLSSW